MIDNRLTRSLAATLKRGDKCLMPYITAGYPDLATTTQVITRCSQAGCPAIEVGFPFSDSIADGPVIQESFYRALDAGFRVEPLFESVAGCRSDVSAGLLAMVSMSLVSRYGVEAFCRRAAGSGFDGLIVPDVPVDECAGLARMAADHGLCNVLMDAPTSHDQRRRRIADLSTGFIYVITSRGITGERSTVAADLASHVAALRAQTQTPLIAGFGISTTEHVREVCRHADGAIVGSAIIRRMGACIDRNAPADEITAAIGTYVDELLPGTRPDSGKQPG